MLTLTQSFFCTLPLPSSFFISEIWVSRQNRRVFWWEVRMTCEADILRALPSFWLRRLPSSGIKDISPFLRKSKWSLDLVRMKVQIKPLHEFFTPTTTRLFLEQNQKEDIKTQVLPKAKHPFMKGTWQAGWVSYSSRSFHSFLIYASLEWKEKRTFHLCNLPFSEHFALPRLPRNHFY